MRKGGKTVERICDNCEHCTEDAKGVYVCIVGPREYTTTDKEGYYLGGTVVMPWEQCKWPEGEDHIRSFLQRFEPIDEAKTAKLWAQSEPRYYINLITNRFPGYKEVVFHLFHRYMPEEEARHFTVGSNHLDPYVASYIEEAFSKEELRQLHKYFSEYYEPDRLRARVADPPDNHVIGYGAYPVGGGTDFYGFSEADDYSLPFKVWGFFDLRHSETALRRKGRAAGQAQSR